MLGETVIVHRDASGARIQPASRKPAHGQVVFSWGEGGRTLEFRQGCGAAAEDPKDGGEKGVAWEWHGLCKVKLVRYKNRNSIVDKLILGFSIISLRALVS